MSGGVFVLELLKELETECDIKVTYKFTDKRTGDVPSFYADPTKAKKLLNWNSKRDLKNIYKIAWLNKLRLKK
tara:strand:+ start:840 stop:1058 length:219 start_codon:yes stop_codon:yes gene_type:complete